MKVRSSIIISLGLLALVLFSIVSSEDTTVYSMTEEYSHQTNSSSDDSEETDNDSARKNFQTFCGSNAVAGCKCDGTIVTCNCKDTDLPSENALNFNFITVSTAVKTIRIENCLFVELKGKKLSLDELSIKSAINLLIDGNVLQKLHALNVKDVMKINLETDALASMEASKINFENCKFSDESNVRFKDDSISSKLEFNNCYFPKNSTVYLKSELDELSVVFKECDFDQLKLKITATNLEIKNNRFHQLPTKSSFDVNVHDYLTVTENHLLSSTKIPMPEIDYSPNLSPLIHVSFLLDILNSVMVNNWIGAFHITIDNNKIDKEKTLCNEETKESSEGREHEINCPNIHSLENYFRSPNFKKLPFSGKEPIENSTTLHGSGATTFYPFFAISTLITTMCIFI